MAIFGLVLFLANPGAAANIAGKWNWSESGSITCTIHVEGYGDETETDPVAGSTILTIVQNGSNVSWTVNFSGTNYPRTGTIEGSYIQASGQFIVPLIGSITFTQNTYTAQGTVSSDGNTLNLNGSGNAAGSGSYLEIPFTFTCTGASTVVATRFPVVSIAATDPDASEVGPDPGAFTVTRAGPTTAPLIVYYTVGGTASPVRDYVALPGSVSIPAGADSSPITVTPAEDSLFEGAETVIVTLSPNAAYDVGSPSSATVTIQASQAVGITTPLNQFRWDGLTVIPVGGTVSERTVIFKATVTDFNPAGQVKLQIELRRLTEAGGSFAGIFTHESPPVASGGVAQITVPGLQNTSYHWRARATNGTGDTSAWVSYGENLDSAADFTVAAPPDRIGIVRDGFWYLDDNGNGVWDGCGTDYCLSWGGEPGDKYVVGDWNGDGHTKIGVYRNGFWYLDANGNGTWDGCGIDKCISWGGDPEDKVVLGDWNGDGKTKIGIYRNGTWYLDANGNGLWDGCATDKCIAWGGEAGDIAVLGDWNGDGKTKIGVYRNGTWYLDYNGNGAWDGCATDKCIPWGGDPVDRVVLGDWNGDGATKIGIYRNGTWYLDANGNGTWDGCGIDKCISWGGDPEDKVALGDWNGDGRTKIGIVRNGTWYLDHNGDGQWNGCGIDKCISWGNPDDTFVVGRW